MNEAERKALASLLAGAVSSLLDLGESIDGKLDEGERELLVNAIAEVEVVRQKLGGDEPEEDERDS